jgi:hypothetical protein
MFRHSPVREKSPYQLRAFIGVLTLLGCGTTPEETPDPASGGAGGQGGIVATGGGSAGASEAGTSSFGVGGASGSATGGDTGAGGVSRTPAVGGMSGAGSSAGGSSAGSAPVGGSTIINDRFWKDTAGTPIYSQGGGVLQVGDTYYWYGVKYAGTVAYAANPVDNDNTGFQGITTYSSKDLVSWKLEATDKPSNTLGWFGRLGVAYNEKTKKYVLLAQGGGGLYFATSDKPSGGFVFDHVQTNLPGIATGATGDQTIFQDDDGQAYLVSSNSKGRGNRYISPLRASDFLNAEEAILVYSGGGREGNCMFKYDGHYYFCSSDLHGWNSSQTYCVSASSIKGPYGPEFVLEGTQNDYSHVTQTGFFVAVKGSQQTTIIFAGDRWSDFAGNGLGFNQWLPLSFNGTTPRFHSLSAWKLDASSGAWSVAPENNWVLNPTFEADRISVTNAVGWKATSGANAKDSRTGNWSWQINGNGSLSQGVADLPDGTYTLAVWAKSSGAGAELYVSGGADKKVAIPAGMSWSQVMLKDIAITGGKAELGVTSGGQTVKVNDFTLVGAPAVDDRRLR